MSPPKVSQPHLVAHGLGLHLAEKGSAPKSGGVAFGVCGVLDSCNLVAGKSSLWRDGGGFMFAKDC